jgi:hypothetical protein
LVLAKTLPLIVKLLEERVLLAHEVTDVKGGTGVSNGVPGVAALGEGCLDGHEFAKIEPVVDLLIGEEGEAVVARDGGDVCLVVVEVESVATLDELVHVGLAGILEFAPITVRSVLLVGLVLLPWKHVIGSVLLEHLTGVY